MPGGREGEKGWVQLLRSYRRDSYGDGTVHHRNYSGRYTSSTHDKTAESNTHTNT